MRLLSLLLLLPLAGCDFLGKDDDDDDDDDDEDTAGSDEGVLLSEYFPHDGQREAEFVQEGVDWKLVTEKVDEVDLDGTAFTWWRWSRDDSGDAVGDLYLASEEAGVAIHSWSDETGARVTPDVPIALTGSDGRLGGSPIVTETNEGTFTVEYLGLEDCPVSWGLDWEDCVHLAIDDGDGDSSAGPFFAGEYWLVQRYGPAWMHLTGQATIWDLAHYDWEAEE